MAVLAGDTLPIDVYRNGWLSGKKIIRKDQFRKTKISTRKSHLPVVFENNDIPYVFVPSKHDLGASIGSKRPTCVLLIKPNEAYGEDLGKCLKVGWFSSSVNFVNFYF